MIHPHLLTPDQPTAEACGPGCAHPHGDRHPADDVSSPGTTPAEPAHEDKRSFFFGMMGTPFQTDTVTSLFRMVEAALSQGHRVTVWNCGHATGLSQSTLVRPTDFFAPKGSETVNPNTAELIQALFRRYAHHNQFEWLVCRYCMEERGATHQIAQAKVKIPFSFQHYLSTADVSLVLGVKS